MKWSFRVDGDRKLVESLKSVRERMEAATKKAIYTAGNMVMTDAKQRAPIDLGILRASGYVTMPIAGPKLKVEVGFGGAAAQYALIQHERTEFRHDVGEAKYLQKAFDSTDVKGIIEDIIRRAMESDSPAQLTPGQHRTEPE